MLYLPPCSVFFVVHLPCSRCCVRRASCPLRRARPPHPSTCSPATPSFLMQTAHRTPPPADLLLSAAAAAAAAVAYPLTRLVLFAASAPFVVLSVFAFLPPPFPLPSFLLLMPH
ncbi:hypothetical protein BC628DRAFT_763439 [Trametes gibbosa]|nr:hypothetical protein BC628DRAFT_763439 [Trametes gibbosa]